MQEKLLMLSYQVIASFFLIIFIPIFIILFFLIKFTSQGPFIFKQKRMGKNRKTFTIYKIRTMVYNAEELKHKINHLNEDDGPTFKIREDPRYTKVGKFLSQTAIDELPQLINIIRGEMSFVGPRPLPVDEAQQVPAKYERRFLVLPGMTSNWVIKGAHKLSFGEWMNLDLEYAKKKSLWYDFTVFLQTLVLIPRLVFKNSIKSLNEKI